jgi:CO/xanthine dehydrogenase Mo-binding subunit
MLTGLGPYESAALRIDATGKALLVTGASPHGQGTITTLAQIVADELGIDPAEVTVQHGDTAAIPFGVGTYASRNAVVAGAAAFVAAGQVRDKARALAASLLEASPEDLELADGAVRVVGAPDRQLSLAARRRRAGQAAAGRDAAQSGVHPLFPRPPPSPSASSASCTPTRPPTERRGRDERASRSAGVDGVQRDLVAA